MSVDQHNRGGRRAPVRLTPAAFHILLALADGERHSYGIMREVWRYTQGTMPLGPGTLYRTIRQLLAAGLIEESGEPSGAASSDEQRRCYHLTASGRAVGEREAERLSHLVDTAHAKRLLPEGPPTPPTGSSRPAADTGGP